MLALLAVLLAAPVQAAAPGKGPVAPAAPAAALTLVTPAALTSVTPAAVTPAAPAGAPAVASAPSAFSDGSGPSCAPAAPDRDGPPAVPPRTGGEHAQLPPARPAPEGVRPQGTAPVRVLVRGPDRPAPGPVELSVLRV
ncbi:hypothetical protein Sxan_57980 [Streptomyces xanthophaeus]|uniref:Uncharacterized protein n=1 Tax=Streptomyces xanthophaeus TaxID=67385 RepID=A0A919H6K9_9ACTN|nr:hypothetical protein Sxan_57980 [Streptomyces xanthophaeus]